MYKVYLGKVLLPVTPSKIDIKVSNQNKTVSLANEGEVNILKSAGLTEIDFDFLIPVGISFTDSAKENPRDASFYLENLEKKKQSKKPFVLKILRPNEYDTNIKVSLEDYTIHEDADEGLNKVISVSLKQYKEFGLKTYKVEGSKKKAQKKETEESESSPTPTTQTTYTVKSGDSLYAISKMFYGYGSLYDKIYQVNKSVIDKRNANTTLPKYTIYAGQKLTIPSVSEAKKVVTPKKAEVPKNQSVETMTNSGQLYKVEKGRTLRSIAVLFYGDAERYVEIYESNKALIDRLNNDAIASHNRTDYTHQWHSVADLPQGQYTIWTGTILNIP